MYWFRQNTSLPIPITPGAMDWENCIPMLANPGDTQLSLQHLVALDLLREIRKMIRAPSDRSDDAITITRFGRQFVKACIPEDLDIAKFRGGSAKQAD